MTGWRIVGVAFIACLFMVNARAQDRVLDDFENLEGWSVSATDDVTASLRQIDGPHGKAMCVDFDFGRVTGYVSVHRRLPIDFPTRYAFMLDLRGDAAPNAFQFKLVDATGDNVWWVNRPEYRFPHDWQTIKFRQRQVDFAWGPITDRTLRRTAAIEFVIASGSGAGKGSACFDRLTLHTLPAVAPPIPAPVMGADALSVDYGVPREFSALALHWRAGAAASRYAIELSDDGQTWRRVAQIAQARGDVQAHWLPDSESRFVRVVPDEVAGAGAGMSTGKVALNAIEPRDPPTANAFFEQLAKAAPQGRYPRAYVGQQSYWTVLGVDGGQLASLMNEDGVLEPVPGVGGLEPFLVVDGRVLSWADAHIDHSLRDGDLPMPSVRWTVGDLSLAIDGFGAGSPGAAQVLARYTVRNNGTRPRRVGLALAWRPFQANPPTQFLAHPGGASTIGRIDWDGSTLAVDGVARVRPLVKPDAVRLAPLAAGPVSDWLTEPVGAAGAATAAASAAANAVNAASTATTATTTTTAAATATATAIASQVDDSEGFASAVLRFDQVLPPGAQREIAVALPVSGEPAVPSIGQFDEAERQVAAHWHAQLDRVGIDGPAEVAEIARTVRSSLGQILVNRSGPAVQPGSRAYARSWIRDGALTSSALLRLGHADTAKAFLQWYAPFQFSNGKVPCCATARGADPVPENDSDGEWAFAVTDLWRYTHDDATARALWPHVRAAVGHMEMLRQSERVDRNREPDRRAYFGLMPPSISHEGYSDRPAYSYWDDFWAAIGYRSAARLAAALGHADDAARIGAERDEFSADLLASIAASTASHHMDVLPGAADRGDVDPTSSTMALSPGGFYGAVPGAVPDSLLRATFERYWRDFESRARDEARGIRHGDGAYTPYEWRNVGALVRLGQRDRALQALAYFYRDRRPVGWNQWAEVVVRDPREPRFLGDMPHGWVASDHIRSVLDLFAFEHEGAGSLVLAAGVPMRWLAGDGLRLHDLRTPYGRLNWNARVRSPNGRQVVEFELGPLDSMPPGGIELRGPWPVDSAVSIDGQPVIGRADRIVLPKTPARVRIVLPPPPKK